MKKIFTVLSIAIASVTFAQQTTGRISYDIEMSSDNPQMAPMISQMGESTMDVFFDENNSRTEFSMGGMMTTTTIMHKDADTTLTLMDGMMGKIAMKSTENDISEEEKEKLEDREVELVEGSKEIIGFNCKKAIITDGEGNEMEIWYTNELKQNASGGQFNFKEIEGVPLMFEMKSPQMNMKFIAYEFSKKLKKKDVLFDMTVPKGYTLKTIEDLKKMGMGR